MTALVASRKQKATVAAGVTAKLTTNIGDMIDQLSALRERQKELQAQLDEVAGEYKGVEEQLMAKLEEQGIEGSKGAKASCSITKVAVANVTDWDALFAYIKKTGYFHLLQRRVTDTSYRELLEAGKKVPGVEPFVKKRLNLRAL